MYQFRNFIQFSDAIATSIAAFLLICAAKILLFQVVYSFEEEGTDLICFSKIKKRKASLEREEKRRKLSLQGKEKLGKLSKS